MCFDDIAQQVQCMRICNVSVIFVGLPSKCVIGIISSIVGYELSYFTQWAGKETLSDSIRLCTGAGYEFVIDCRTGRNLIFL